MVKGAEGVKIDFYQLIENSASATILIDDNKIIYANKAMGKMLKMRDSKELIGRSFDFLHPDYHAICAERCKKVMEQQEIAELNEQKLILENGEIIDVEVTAVPFDNDGRTIIQANYQDITDRKTAEKLLIQSEKLSVLGELASGIVHEIRNPLTSIKGFLQLMDTEKVFVKEHIRIVKDEVNRIEEIANDLLFFSKPKIEHFLAENIYEVVKEAVFLFETEAFKRKISIEINAEDEMIMVNGNKNQLKQVVINLIKNGIEAIGHCGKINIYINKNSSKNVCIVIKDSGNGIPKEKLKYLGQSFFSTKEKGTGLGLMVTYNIIKNHNGTIYAESELNKGTSFTIELPQAT